MALILKVLVCYQNETFHVLVEVLDRGLGLSQLQSEIRQQLRNWLAIIGLNEFLLDDCFDDRLCLFIFSFLYLALVHEAYASKHHLHFELCLLEDGRELSANLVSESLKLWVFGLDQIYQLVDFFFEVVKGLADQDFLLDLVQQIVDRGLLHRFG